LRWRLLAAYLLPTLLLIGAFAILVERAAEQTLEMSLGRRLVSIAQATTTLLRPDVVEFLAPGDDESRSARRLRLKLTRMLQITGSARIFVLDHELRVKADTHTGRIGDRHYHAEADRLELRHVFTGQSASSVLFVGAGGAHFKAGYAPLMREGKVIAAVGVEGSAAFFLIIKRLRVYLLLSAGVVALLLIAVSFLAARRITRPLTQLAEEATRIGAGQLEQPIVVRSADEVGLLASTMNEMRGALRQREEQMQMMLSGIAHEVRNPLGGISLFAGLLREEVSGNTEQQEMVHRIERELEHLERVVDDFLTYARHGGLQLSPVHLDTLVEEVAEVMCADAQKAHIELKLKTEPVRALANRESLRRLLLNLVANAIQACDEGGRVTLECADAATPTLRVDDNGKGMDEELQAKVFQPFFTTREKGTGLGLAISHKIVTDHGGSLRIESKPGEGTSISVSLRPC